MASIIQYLTLIGKRLYRPVRPVINPTLQLIKVWQLLLIIAVIELIAALKPLPQEIIIKNSLAAWPWSQSTRRSAELIASGPGRLQKEITAWEKVLTEQNESRDVLLRLSLLYYRLYEDETAKTYWQRAFYLDPGFVTSLPVQLF